MELEVKISKTGLFLWHCGSNQGLLCGQASIQQASIMTHSNLPFFEGLTKLPRLALNSQTSCISLPSRWDYRCVPHVSARHCHKLCCCVLTVQEDSINQYSTVGDLLYFSVCFFMLYTVYLCQRYITRTLSGFQMNPTFKNFP